MNQEDKSQTKQENDQITHLNSSNQPSINADDDNNLATVVQ